MLGFPTTVPPEIKETVKIFLGYIDANWTNLQEDLKQLYWPHDKPKNTMSTLDRLVKDAGARHGP